ncbi:hypothetical protein DMN91_007874 [Ooceraea biroi]|uniref:Uncharacterized protein n=1 Tax=Ooceraea biroi TaxID=2015173 RepID=A0A026X210_OOCBI|nr:uncharacterized protein LOC105280044 [Ooceraea biroi]EZA62036.1 hypothetical protein X777_06722 [Ooceraea biroi]RLU19317.1 hypothetical protein DMN91_007874 [Ooceraea biroi]
MRKAVPVLVLIAFACDFSARDVLVDGNPARKPEAAVRSDDYEHQTDSRGQFDDAEAPRRSIEDRGRSNEPIGKWRSNGEALEPKWRDGDSVPLLPFSHYRSYSRDDEADDAEHEDYPATSRRPSKYRYSIDQPNRSRGSPGRRAPAYDYDYDYDVTSRDRDFDDRDHDYPRRRPRPHGSTIYEETLENAASSDGKRGRNIVDASPSDQQATSRYHEAFQARPNEYAQEFNDEEYLKPRPRKRRPPQNYEFALANAASTEGDEALRDPSESSSQLTSGNPPVTTQPSDNNALELKMLLKMQQEEGSSLSEILQRRNLTLSDLLEGKADVINALKARITDSESEEYIEEMSRVMSNSLMKIASTTTPPTESAQTSMSTTTSVATSSALDNSVSETTPASNELKSHDTISSNNASRIVKKELEDVEGATQPVHDSSWLKATTSAIVSTLITTTSTSSPVAVNSMEYFLNDDGNAESTSDQRSAARLENLDEDEIMEFSDFMDFKKGKSQAAPVLLSLSSGKVTSQQTSPRDIVSTLSIEHILHPTERIKLMKHSQDNRDTAEDGEEAIQGEARSALLDETSMEDYNAFIEAEYQNDAPIDIPEEDRRQSEEIKYDPSKTGTLVSSTEKQRIANPADDRRGSYDKNHSTEYHQVNQSMERIRMLENHRGTNGRRYEEVVSEIEPEARAEIFELFASGSAGKRLERLLKSRNMSVEELIALRQRGSSKVHLTEVSRLQVADPKNLQASKTSDVNNKKIVSATSNSNNENDSEEENKKNQFRQDIISYLHDPLFDRDLENTSLSRLLDLVERDRNTSREITFQKEDQKGTSSTDEHGELESPRHAIEIVDLLTTFGSLPFAEDVRRQFGIEFGNEAKAEPPIDNNNANVRLIGDEENIVRSDNTSDEFHAGYVEEIVRKEPNVVRTIHSETRNDAEENKTLSRVKPSIIASGVILGVTIVVFLAIFAVCRIRQKQRYTYRNTFSRTVFQSSIAAARKLSNSSSLSAVMVNVAATSTTRRPERTEMQETVEEFDSKSDMDNDSLDANDSWETIPDYAK